MVDFHIGFSGSRNGMTDAQLQTLRLLIGAHIETSRLPDDTLIAHHGDCVGSDVVFHDTMRELGSWIVGHPPDSDYKRAFCDVDQEQNPKGYLERDKDIVLESDLMFFTPNNYVWRPRSGTWYTAKCAKKHNVTGFIIFPDGEFDTVGNIL